MADSPVFEWIATALERETALGRLEARGTVRLALKRAGLEARTLTARQMGIVLRRILPDELERRGIADSAALCGRLLADLPAGGPVQGSAPEEIFRRLGGGP